MSLHRKDRRTELQMQPSESFRVDPRNTVNALHAMNATHKSASTQVYMAIF
eukprot:m.1578 g.1578  ORF g.1578 m.1578 type:complete len:51 (-) comp1754_c0_seq1:79-231(-)